MTQATPKPPVIESEKHVKREIKKLLDKHGWFSWMPPANGYGTTGIHDFNAIRDGVFMTIEAKYGKNKPTPGQKAFAGHMIANDALTFAVNEKMLGWLAVFLESFDISCEAAKAEQEPPAEHGSRMLNATKVLQSLFD